MYSGKTTVLRELREEDLKDITLYVNDYDIYSDFTDSAPFPKTIEFQRKWMENSSSDKIRTFAIEIRETHEFIGTCQLRAIDVINKSATLSIIIGKKNVHGKGYGSDAMQLLLRYGFMELNLNRITLQVYSDNKGAIRLYEKSGFIKEGILKKEIYRKGRYFDQLTYGLTREDFFKEERINE